MKKIIGVLISCLCVIAVIYCIFNTNIAFNVISKFDNKVELGLVYKDAWYYDKLTEEQKLIYTNIDNIVMNFEESFSITFDKEIKDYDVQIAYEAYLMDNPAVCYIDTKFNIKKLEIAGMTRVKIELDYISSSKAELNSIVKTLESEADNVIDLCIEENMTDYEKELAIHDYLASKVSYYEYENVDSIPYVKHTAYGALIGREAVCDGYAKAFKYIMDKLGISTVVISGNIGEESHAWNKVCLSDEWYNVDVTSDRMGQNASHVYFNLSDEKISRTHTEMSDISVPNATGTKYNYFTYNDFTIAKNNNLNVRLSNIMRRTKSEILEFEVLDSTYTIEKIVNELYALNFNNYKANKTTEVEYSYKGNVYMFIKK